MLEANDLSKSLCAQALRAKYYLDGDLLRANAMKGTSFTWQSIMVRLETFKKSYIWRIGDGNIMNMSTDLWIPSSQSIIIISPRGQSILTKVNELIDPHMGQWDEQLIIFNFFPVYVRRILQISLNFSAFLTTLYPGTSQNSVFFLRQNGLSCGVAAQIDRKSAEPNPVRKKGRYK